MTQFLTYFKINAPKVVFETYENEVVLINLDRGIYYSISNTAAEIFSQVEQERSKAWILEGIINKYEGNTTIMVSSVEKFLEDMLNEGLIIREEKNIDAIPSLDKEKVNKNTIPVKLLFESPVLNRYSDMQDLLLLDPVHDVDETGWPNPKPPDPAPEVEK
jgi:hypothetical protein